MASSRSGPLSLSQNSTAIIMSNNDDITKKLFAPSDAKSVTSNNLKALLNRNRGGAASVSSFKPGMGGGGGGFFSGGGGGVQVQNRNDSSAGGMQLLDMIAADIPQSKANDLRVIQEGLQILSVQPIAFDSAEMRKHRYDYFTILQLVGLGHHVASDDLLIQAYIIESRYTRLQLTITNGMTIKDYETLSRVLIALSKIIEIARTYIGISSKLDPFNKKREQILKIIDDASNNIKTNRDAATRVECEAKKQDGGDGKQGQQKQGEGQQQGQGGEKKYKVSQSALNYLKSKFPNDKVFTKEEAINGTQKEDIKKSIESSNAAKAGLKASMFEVKPDGGNQNQSNRPQQNPPRN